MSTIKADAITASTGTNTNIAITGKGSGKVKLGDGNLLFPDSDGAAGTAIVTNGSGTLSFAATGKVVQVVNVQTGAVATGTTVMPFDDTIPQITEGDQYMSLAITPTSATNKLRIDVCTSIAPNANIISTVALFVGTTANALAAILGNYHGANVGSIHIDNFSHYMTAGATTELTFRVRSGGHASNTTTFNGRAGGRYLGGVAASSITITEISA